MIKQIFTAVLLAVACSLSAQTPEQLCSAQIPYGKPVTSKQDVTTICRSAYILEHDNKAKIPQWVAYTLKPEHVTGCVKRSNAFAPDPSLPRGIRSELKDYVKSGYDMGHQANDGDMSWDYTVERESFYLSNMAPQLPSFNRGIWKKLEDQTRAWAANRQNTLLIYVGPVYNTLQDSTIGTNRVIVPHGFFKIIVDTKTREVMVFEFDHKGSSEPLQSFMTSIADVQRMTNVVFPLPENATVTRTIWPSVTKSVRGAKKNVCSIN